MHVLPALAAAKDVQEKRGLRAQSTKRKQAAAAMDAPLKTTFDLTIPAAAPSAARSSPATTVAAAAEVVVAPGSATSAPPSVRRKHRAPPPESGSDDLVSDGGSFDGFDSDLIESCSRNCERSSSESEEEQADMLNPIVLVSVLLFSRSRTICSAVPLCRLLSFALCVCV